MNTVPDDQDEVKSPNLRMSRLGLVRPRTEFARNILTLVTGTSVAQVLPLLAMPILSRMYTKEDFGNYNLFVSLASLLAILVSGRYELAVMLPKDDEDAVNIFSLSMWLGGIFCSIALVVSILFHEQILTLLKAPDFGIWLFFVPPMAVLTVCYQTYNYWFNRFQLYRRLSINRVTRNGLVTGSKLALGARAAAKPLFVGGLIIGEVVGQLLALLTFWRHFRIEHKDIARRISRDRMMSVLRRYRAFPFYTVPADLVNELSRRLPTFFIIPTFGTAINGEFSLTLLALGVPLSLVASAFADVFKQRAAVAFNEHGNCVALWKNTFVKLVLISTPIFLFAYLAAPTLVPIVLGRRWEHVGAYAQALTPYFYLSFIASPLSRTLFVAEKQQYDLIWQIALLVIVFTTLKFSLAAHDPVKMLTWYGSGYVLMYLIYLGMSYHFSKGNNTARLVS